MKGNEAAALSPRSTPLSKKPYVESVRRVGRFLRQTWACRYKYFVPVWLNAVLVVDLAVASPFRGKQDTASVNDKVACNSCERAVQESIIGHICY